MKLIIGLGNIGKAYINTNHNVGFMVADKLAKNLGIKFSQQDCKSDVAIGFFGDEKVIIAKPRTYMNSSGDALREFLNKYKDQIDIGEDVVIVYDDIDLQVGTIRVKESGSAGTHNGMKSIMTNVEGDRIKRVRVGIGCKPENMTLVDFVLSRIGEGSPIFEATKLASEGLAQWLNKEISFSTLMQKMNSQG
ncbi:MAG: aminoacyl-tRNA hydrolase [Clostridia bacterium]|nr:aminoacyl-tRNA hydrolase [Clostridia bacterium]